MNRKMFEDHLEQAERHVAIGQAHIRRQRELIVQLRRDGQDYADATQLLVQAYELQALNIADHDRLLKELQKSL